MSFNIDPNNQCYRDHSAAGCQYVYKEKKIFVMMIRNVYFILGTTF